MEKKIDALSLTETQTVVGGVKTIAMSSMTATAVHVSRPNAAAASAMVAETHVSRPTIDVSSLLKR